MEEQEENYIVDAGNTRIKIAKFINDELISSDSYSWNDRKVIKKELLALSVKRSLLSSVLSDKDQQWVEDLCNPSLVLTHKTPLPISIDKYATPITLGADRIANAVAAAHQSKDNNLIIDFGTCIKYDFIDDKKNYHGGAISPGLAMRFKAMHEFTGKLPLINEYNTSNFIGDSTISSMKNGVLIGIQGEINEFIQRYTQKFGSLTIFLTGGDAKRFDIVYKNSIFVDYNLTVKGLYLILKHNAHI